MSREFYGGPRDGLVRWVTGTLCHVWWFQECHRYRLGRDGKMYWRGRG